MTKSDSVELLKLGIISTSPYLSRKLLLPLVRNCVILFGKSMVLTFYGHKDRKKIIGALIEVQKRGSQRVSKS